MFMTNINDTIFLTDNNKQKLEKLFILEGKDYCCSIDPTVLYNQFYKIISNFCSINNQQYDNISLNELYCVLSTICQYCIEHGNKTINVFQIGWSSSVICISQLLKLFNKKNTIYCLDDFDELPSKNIHSNFIDSFEYYDNIIKYYNICNIKRIISNDINDINSFSNNYFDIIIINKDITDNHINKIVNLTMLNGIVVSNYNNVHDIFKGDTFYKTNINRKVINNDIKQQFLNFNNMNLELNNKLNIVCQLVESMSKNELNKNDIYNGCQLIDDIVCFLNSNNEKLLNLSIKGLLMELKNYFISVYVALENNNVYLQGKYIFKIKSIFNEILKINSSCFC